MKTTCNIQSRWSPVAIILMVAGFMHELRRAKDKEEFDRFMSQRERRNGEGFDGAAPSGAPA